MMYEEDNLQMNAYDARNIANSMVQTLQSNLPEARVEIIGSLLKARANEPCEEIEILVGFNREEGEEETVQEVKEVVEREFDVYTKLGVGSFKGEISFVYETDESSIDVTVHVTHGFDLVKAVHRGKKNTDFSDRIKELLFQEFISVAVMGDGYESIEENGLTVAEWKLSINKLKGTVERCYRVARRKKDGSVSMRTPDTVRWEDSFRQREFVTNKFQELLKIAGGNQIRWTDVISLENMLRFLFSGRYAYPERLPKIYEKTMNQIKKSSAGMDENDTEKFANLWNQYQQSEQGGQLNEGRLNSFAMKMNNLNRRMEIL